MKRFSLPILFTILMLTTSAVQASTGCNGVLAHQPDATRGGLNNAVWSPADYAPTTASLLNTLLDTCDTCQTRTSRVIALKYQECVAATGTNCQCDELQAAMDYCNSNCSPCQFCVDYGNRFFELGCAGANQKTR